MMLPAYVAPIHAVVVSPAERYLDGVDRIGEIDLRLRATPLSRSDVSWADLVILEGRDYGAVQADLPADFPMLVLIRAGSANMADAVLAASVVRVPVPPERIAAAVRAVAQGLAVSDRAVAERRDATVAHQGERLTSREQEVLRLLARGKTNKAIADLLGVSDQTVKSHVSAILAKLQAESRTEAVAIAARRGLVML